MGQEPFLPILFVETDPAKNVLASHRAPRVSLRPERLLRAAHPRIYARAARFAAGRERIESQQRLERETGARGDLPAAHVGVVHADLDAARTERVEGQARHRMDRLGHHAAALATGLAPVADLEAAQRPVDAVQAGAAEKFAFAAVCPTGK